MAGIGAALGGAAAAGTSIFLSIVTGNRTFIDNANQALFIGLVGGSITAVSMTAFPNYLDSQVYGRINLLPSLGKYAVAFPGDVVALSLFVVDQLLCDGKGVSSQGGSCEL